jgi:hypothetical protein
MSLVSPDSNEIGRYAGTTSLATTIQALLNLGLDAVSASFSKFVRTRTVYKRAPLSVASGSGFAAFQLPTLALGNAFTRSGNVYTCAVPGEYRVTLCLSYDGNATGNRGAQLVCSNATIGNRSQIIAALSNSADQTVEVELVGTFAAGDTITPHQFQSSGASRLVQGHLIFDRVV